MQAVGEQPVAACRCGHFLGQAALQRGYVDGIDQFLRGDRDGLCLQHGRQRGRATLVALLRNKRCVSQFGGCGQLRGRLLQQRTGLPGAAAAS